jgi:uncharacterized membrane protein (DUF373 family)
METGHDATPLNGARWTRVFKAFELMVILFLMGMLMIVIALSALELGWLLLADLSSVRELLLDVEEMFDLFGFFLLVLIGLELFTSLKTYIREGVIQVEVVLEVALIAIAQKIIILDTSRATALALLGQAALVLALAGAFWLVRVARAPRQPVPGPPPQRDGPRDHVAETAAGDDDQPPTPIR